ncbi:MAG: DUF333 domain-containing protein [Mesorhizobium sp.]|nr:DUF333 domain-containing protein [bacterium M00.F.Ca.ET.205.01.1.1]TGU55240.1 DUF333 domain-containing protein [bacterium M00.F.Ca.ET.152.01.1.1]TGV40463.1 DUF333 domain-containing protein [Mesorhizobium sp. M00.F.Ca.ET.186.01.1.1]TGZ45466.1 DUF333 domain-containing protein [bacterium M00.F.Ca.ET.162.01.1.1]TIW61301.1 MAG: DUF333 domain-containing protein [Mesorhizobium sp.]
MLRENRDEKGLVIGHQPCRVSWIQADAGPSQQVGMANPASVHSGAIGGRLVVRKDKAGNEYGICRLPNGRLCEEWALFRDNKCVGLKAAMRRK